MNGEEIVYKLSIDDTAAKDEINNLGHAAQRVGQPGGGVHQLGETLDKIGGKAGKDAAGALRSASAAMGGLGGAAGEALGVIGDFADVLTGGPLVAGLAALGAGIAFAVHQYEAAKQATQDFHDAINAVGTFIDERHKQQLADMAEGIRKLTDELNNFGKDSRQVFLDGLVFQLSAAESHIDSVDRRLQRARSDLAMETGKMEPNAERVDDLQQQVTTFQKVSDDIHSTATETRSRLSEATRVSLELDAAEANRDNRAAARAAARAASAASDAELLAGPDVGESAFGLAITDPEAFAAQQAASRDKAVDIFAQADDKLRDTIEAGELRRVEAHRAALDEMLGHEREYFDKVHGYYTDLATTGVQGFASAAIGSIAVYANAAAAHHKHAAEEAQIAFEQAVGSNLVALGQRALFEGGEILLASHGLDPAGYGLVTLGGAAIAAGVGFGAHAAGVQAHVSASQAKDTTSSAGAKHGSGGGLSGGGTGGGGVTVINNYGVAGPRAEDSARDTVELWRIANRRRFT